VDISSKVFDLPFTQLKDRFANATDIDVMRHALGLQPITFSQSIHPVTMRAREVADRLAKQVVVVCIDTEHYTLNSDEMTEIGVVILHTQDVLSAARAGDFGDHGDNFMKKLKFHFLRLREKAHLPITNARSRGPAGNRFGSERFVTFEQARSQLRQLLVQPIAGTNSLQRYNHPIIILGHAIAHDRDHLNNKDLGLDIDSLGTIIRYIDTQDMVRDIGCWWNGVDNIGLRSLVEKLGFAHSDAHTASNDAARTMMCAILMALPRAARGRCARSMQQVASELEAWSQKHFVSLGGSARYCSKCSSTVHNTGSCDATGLQCRECLSRGLSQEATTHVELHCPIVRDEVAAERLKWYDDQRKDGNPKHPFSSRERLQTFGPKAPRVIAPTPQEVTARRQFYDSQQGTGEPLEPFTWYRRLFSHSPLRHSAPGKLRSPLTTLTNTNAQLSRSSNGVGETARGGGTRQAREWL
jgi:hypothetical protein